MKNCLLLFAGIILFLKVSGQSKRKDYTNGIIKGSVLDSATGKALDYATISVFQPGDKMPVNGTTSSSSGKFFIDKIASGRYYIVVEYIGYRPRIIGNIVITQSNPTIDLDNVFLVRSNGRLPTINVFTPQQVLENEVDKTVFNVENDITSSGGVATDVLQKIPQVSVDADGAVELAGSPSIRFLIDGKPSTVFGSDITDVLQSIPASEIKSVEVIVNPGARYDAAGLGGIINIILKKNNQEGVNGSLSGTVSTRVENGSFNFNARKKNFGVTAFLNGFDRLNASTPESYERVSLNTNTDTITHLIQNGRQTAGRNTYQSGIGFNWTFDKKDFISGSVHYNNYRKSENGVIGQSQIIGLNDNSGTIINDINSLNNSSYNSKFHTTDLNFYYKRTFKKEDQTLELSANTSIEGSHDNSGNVQTLLPMDSIFYGLMTYNPGKEEESEFRIDYNQPFSKMVSLGLGAKLSMDDIQTSSSVLGYLPDQKIYVDNNSLTDNLDYHQRVYAGYGQISFPMGKQLSAQVGERFERTEVNALYLSNQQPSDPNYSTFFPSAFLSQKLPRNQAIKLTYSRRIQRPDYDDLNPFINTSDPKNVISGNPHLLAQTADRFEFSYSKGWGKTGTLILAAFYQANQHDIQNYVLYYPSLMIGDSTYTNVAVSTRENIGSERDIGLSIYGDIDFSKKLALRLNSFLFYRKTVNTEDSNITLTSFNYRVNLNLTYTFSKGLASEFFGNFNSARHEAQGSYPSFILYTIALRKELWNKKASVAITATNPFNEYINRRISLSGPGFIVSDLQQLPFRAIGINFTWKFGRLEFRNSQNQNFSNPNQEPGY